MGPPNLAFERQLFSVAIGIDTARGCRHQGGDAQHDLIGSCTVVETHKGTLLNLLTDIDDEMVVFFVYSDRNQWNVATVEARDDPPGSGWSATQSPVRK
jgi:hypothetical protein